MAQIIQGPETFASGLAQGLQQLAQIKMEQMQQRHQQGKVAEGLKSLMPNASPEERMQIAALPEPVLKEWVHRKMLEPQERAYAQALQGQAQGMQPELQPTQESAMQTGQNPIGAISNQAPMPNLMGLNQQQATKIAEMKQQERLAKDRIAAKSASEDKAYRNETYKTAQKQLPQMRQDIQSDKELEQDLKELMNLNRTGKLIQGKEHIFLKSIGMEDFFTNDVTQMAKKDIERMSVALMRTFKTGGKMTDFIAKTLKATFPGLINNKSGFDNIAKSVFLQTRLNRKYKEETRDLQAEYQKKGLAIPLDLDEQVAMRVKPFEDAINQKRLVYIGRAMTQNPPDLAPKLKGLKNGTIIQLNGVNLKKIDNEWIPQMEEEEL